ncbi:MAG TPA: hypothetical protein VIU40_15870 [Geobacteraceae bacterium]
MLAVAGARHVHDGGDGVDTAATIRGDTNECPVLCSICGGECCRTKPGIDGPERVLATPDPAEALFLLINSGFWVLDQHYGTHPAGEAVDDGDERPIHYPRPATLVEREEMSFLAIPGPGECVFLGVEGCLLPFAERPRMCRALEPEVNFECRTSWTRRDAALVWLPSQEMVAAVLARLRSRCTEVAGT